MFQNQHKLIQQLLVQGGPVRACSGHGGTQQQAQLRVEEDDNFPKIAEVPPLAAPFPMTIEHAADVGEQFKVRPERNGDGGRLAAVHV